MELVTLYKGDPTFESYLDGTFSSDRRALPVETLLNQRERVTFRVVPVASVNAPAWPIVYVRAVRPELVTLTLGPAIATWLLHVGPSPAWTRPSAWFALAGVFFLHVAGFVTNDVQDHMTGTDRVNRGRGSRVLQKGWTTAARMRIWARVNFALAILCGVIASRIAPREIATVVALAAVALMALHRRIGIRTGLGDVCLALVFGPLLTIGVALASFGTYDLGDLALGLAFGLTTAWTLQVRQFENLFRAEPRGFRTYLGHLNFDGARRACALQGLTLLAVVPAAAVVLRVPLIFLAVFPLVGSRLIRLLHRVFGARSPLSSGLTHCALRARRVHLYFAAWWLIALGAAWL